MENQSILISSLARGCMMKSNSNKKVTAYMQIISIATIVVIAALTEGCASFRSPYKGKVVHAQTGRPLAKALVVANWRSTAITVAGGVTKCKDAREVLTDENGEFEIQKLYFGDIRIVIFKLGFKPINCLWSSLDLDGGCMPQRAVWDKDRAIIPLRQATQTQLKWEGRPPRPCGRKDGKPMVEYIRAIKAHRRALGLKD
jgi:hypothetical protein